MVSCERGVNHNFGTTIGKIIIIKCIIIIIIQMCPICNVFLLFYLMEKLTNSQGMIVLVASHLLWLTFWNNNFYVKGFWTMIQHPKPKVHIKSGPVWSVLLHVAFAKTVMYILLHPFRIKPFIVKDSILVVIYTYR